MHLVQQISQHLRCLPQVLEGLVSNPRPAPLSNFLPVSTLQSSGDGSSSWAPDIQKGDLDRGLDFKFCPHPNSGYRSI